MDKAENTVDTSPVSTQVEAENQNAVSPAAVSEGQQSAQPTEKPEAEQPKSLLDAVKGALKKRSEDEATDKAADSGAESQTAKGEGEDADKAGSDEPSGNEDEFPGGSEKSKQRWNKLLEERKAYQAKAQQWDQFSQFARDTGLNAEELTNSLTIARLVKQDPHEALTILRGVVKNLETQTGATPDALPEDLQAKVDRGLLDEESAVEIAMARTKTKMTTERQQREAAEREEAQKADQQARFIHAVSTAVSGFERQLETSDPDYPRIKGLVKAKVVELITSEGAPETPELAVEQVKRAVSAVKKEVGALVPNRQQNTRTVTGGSQAATAARPNSALEAARMALQGRQPTY